MTICPVCGEPNPARASFCLSCGTQLPAAAATSRPARKTVTVVFTDLAGSGALGQRLDPESLAVVMARWFDHLRAILERHGGRVQKFVGDAVVAVFGIPVANEDDALRAVRAAAGLRGLDQLNDELERDWGLRLQARTGVNTGEVVTGDPAIGDALVLGDAVNVAARLEQVAAPGEVLLGQSTYRLVRDAVSAERVTPLHLKGRGAPVVAYRLRQVDPGAPGHARRQDAPIVGREPELRLFTWVYERVVSTRSSHLLTILGQAGQGKTRLVGEAVAALGGATVLRGRCLSYGEGITYWPVAEVVRQAAGIADTDPPAEARAKLDRLVDAGADAPGDHPGRERRLVAARIAQLIGLEAGPGPAEEAPWAFRRLLELLADRNPPARRSSIGDASRPAGAPAGPGQASRAYSTGALVVVLDDLHWAEPGLLDLVEHVADYGRGAPILLVAMARPEFLEQRTGWAGGKLNATTLLLEPLGDAEATRLLAALAGPVALPAEVARRITTAAEGNPLFLEELLAALVEEGRLRRSDGRWEAADLGDLGIPPSIQALLTARLDRLEDPERAVLERAAVAGQVFEQSAVVELTPPAERGSVPARLQALVRRELLRPAPSRLGGDQGFQFRHLLLRDATYDSVPKQARAELHELFAVWVERVAGPRLREIEEIVGYHLEQAWRYRVELGMADQHNQRLAAAAARRLGAAGRRALGRGDLPAASKLLERAVSLLPVGDPGGLELLVELADVLVSTGDFPRAEALLEQVAAAAAGRGDERLAAHARVGRLRMEVGVASDLDTDALQGETRWAIATFAEFEDQRGLAKAWGLLAALGFLRCRIAEAEAAAGQAMTHARLARDDPAESWARGLLAQSAFWGPVPATEGIRRCQELLEQAAGNRRLELTALQSMAGLQAMAGQPGAALATAERALALAGDMGENRVAALAREFVAGALALAGDPAGAERQLRLGIRVLERQGESGMRSNLTADLAHVLHQLGRPDEALQAAMACQAIAAHDDLFAQVRWRGAAARSLAAQDRLAEAERLAAEAVAIAAPTDMLSMRADALLDQAAVATAAGRPADAAHHAKAALALYRAKDNHPGATRAEAAAAQPVPRPTS
ncbi:MAG TPA: adenylate/guanylate cyclase domain-containing protein [Actinomycetota bacterium]|nr:adenylate/guanylate cyclase domain-containing protein [Actinomycetota bacterium]